MALPLQAGGSLGLGRVTAVLRAGRARVEMALGKESLTEGGAGTARSWGTARVGKAKVGQMQ